MLRLKDKIAIVTGASRGIGASIATTLASKGVKVALISRGIDSLESIEQKSFPKAVKLFLFHVMYLN